MGLKGTLNLARSVKPRLNYHKPGFQKIAHLGTAATTDKSAFNTKPLPPYYGFAGEVGTPPSPHFRFQLLSAVDERAGEWFGWTVPTANHHRLTLTKKGWFLIERLRSKNGLKADVYRLGKAAVAEATANTP